MISHTFNANIILIIAINKTNIILIAHIFNININITLILAIDKINIILMSHIFNIDVILISIYVYIRNLY